MLITQITTWEGTPAAIEAVVAGSREAAPIHEGLGAKNPRLMRSVSGGDVHQVEYMIDFDSFEAQGKFSDAIVDVLSRLGGREGGLDGGGEEAAEGCSLAHGFAEVAQ